MFEFCIYGKLEVWLRSGVTPVHRHAVRRGKNNSEALGLWSEVTWKWKTTPRAQNCPARGDDRDGPIILLCVVSWSGTDHWTRPCPRGNVVSDRLRASRTVSGGRGERTTARSCQCRSLFCTAQAAAASRYCFLFLFWVSLCLMISVCFSVAVSLSLSVRVSFCYPQCISFSLFCLSVSVCVKLQTLVYDILPSTTAVFRVQKTVS